MKRLSILLTLAFVAVATSVSAKGDLFSGEGYSRTYVSFSEVSLNWAKGQDANEVLYPFDSNITLGRLKSGKLFAALPLHIEYGLNLQYMYGDESTSILGVETDYKAYTLSVNAPIHASLNLALGKVALTPYAGVNLRYNILGVQTTATEVGSTTTNTEVRLFDSSDEKGAAGKDAWERFQAGLSYGVSLTIGPVTLGAGILTDLMPLVDRGEDNSATLSMKTISLGYSF
ncbi:MAG: hypothetical protein J6V05_04610 [Alistipes sp.]|nr:hypothetical protein [Alistipes sp.]